MTGQLVAAGIDDPRLRAAYAQCRRLNARHGRTYYLATLLLPAPKRPYVHALYGFARLVDDAVDCTGDPGSAAQALGALERDFVSSRPQHPVVAAVRDTIARWSLDQALFAAFFASMRSDLTVTSYDSWQDLCGYMYGSAAVIGLQMLPILGPLPGREDEAARRAVALGQAFQLTNFLRDVGEDLRRGRLYLPLEDLAAHGVTRDQLDRGHVDGRVRRLLAFEVGRARELFAAARPGVALLDPTSQDCIATAHRLYAGILDRIEAVGYRVLDRRVAVGPVRRARVALPALVRARRSRRSHHSHQAID